jgi:hypothetical protein
MQTTTQQTTFERIAQMEALYNDLMQDYYSLVLPFGLRDIPEETSTKATEVMNHACNVLDKLKKMMVDAGVTPVALPPKSNAKLLQEHANTPEFRASVLVYCDIAEKDMTEFMVQEVFFFLEEHDSSRKAEMIDRTDFWVWVFNRVHPVNISVVAMALGGVLDKMILRQHLYQGIQRRFNSMETYSNYLLTFPK